MAGRVHDIVRRLEQLEGCPLWNVWRGFGSHLFCEGGEPIIDVAPRIARRKFEVGGYCVDRRSASVRGSCGFHIEMAAWTVHHAAQQVASSESCDTTFRQITRWFCGQSLVSATLEGATAIDIRLDLGAHLAIRLHAAAAAADPLLTVWDDSGSMTLCADGRRPPERGSKPGPKTRHDRKAQATRVVIRL